MITQNMWQLFKETGEPVGYLLYKACDKKVRNLKETQNRKNDNGQAEVTLSPVQ